MRQRRDTKHHAAQGLEGDIRKMEPLERALAGKSSGSPACAGEQSQGARADAPLIDTTPTLTAPNSTWLANWTWGDVWHYINVHGVDYKPAARPVFPQKRPLRALHPLRPWAKISVRLLQVGG
ncbi:MAG: phosphoadenosine phosphosulfate reductase family protein [Rhodoferax sp.]|nr:phosphoadenosine phosphosulfate reductase family protein [Rhodoferax sp.]